MTHNLVKLCEKQVFWTVALIFGLVAFGSNASAQQRANADFDGDGKTDFSIIRDQTVGGLLIENSSFLRATSARERLRITRDRGVNNKAIPENHGTSLVWYINKSSDNSAKVVGHGTAETDFNVPADYDGDGMDDLAVWRGVNSTTGIFYILESSTNTVREEMFGVFNDDAQIVGDYDGDGTADLAVYRCPTTPGQCFFYFRGSNDNEDGNITYVPWGFGVVGDVPVNPGDFDGDGKYDFCIQRNDGNGNGQFVLLKSSDFGVEFITWGKPNDFIIPGDYDGDGKSDFMVRRTVAGLYHWYLLERDGGGTGASPFIWGISGDVEAPGDYDNDGMQDIAVWRPSNDPDGNYFYVRRSSDASLQTLEWGREADVPVANWYVH